MKISHTTYPTSTTVATDGALYIVTDKVCMYSIDGGVTFTPPDISGANYKLYTGLSNTFYDIVVSDPQTKCKTFFNVYIPYRNENCCP